MKFDPPLAAPRVRSRPGRPLSAQWGPMIRLSLPVIFAELGWMVMGIVDTLMVGGLGPEAIGAVSVGGNLHFAVVIFGVGLLLGLDTVVSQAVGARLFEEGQRGLIQSLYLCALISPPLILIQLLLADHLADLGISAAVEAMTRPYLKAMAWGTLPLFVLGAFRRYLQAVKCVRPIVLAVVAGNLVNWLGNWILIHGHFGMPALGVTGSGWSTTAARFAMALFLIGAAVVREWRDARPFWRVPLGFDGRRCLALTRLGLPAALQLTLEIGVFALATTLAGRLPPSSLAAHQVALNVASLTFMVPLGIASAASVRVGHAVGRRDPAETASAAWSAIALGVGAMAVFSVVMMVVPKWIAACFTDDHETLAIATRLLRVAAGFQLFDGLQVVTTGVLRGAGDTKTAMIGGLVAHWGIGLPVGAWLGLARGWGVVGLWIGLSAGLVAAGLVLLAAWLRMARRLARDSEVTGG